MNPVILIIQYQPSELQKALSTTQWREQAEQIGRIDGLKRKYWLIDQKSGARGGVYLFEDPANASGANIFLTQSLADAGATDITSKTFEVDGDLSSITRVLF